MAPVATAGEAAKRSAMGGISGISTGRVIWSESFDEGIMGVTPQIMAGNTFFADGSFTYHGRGSAIARTSATPGQGSGFYLRTGNGGNLSRVGIAMACYPMVETGVGALGYAKYQLTFNFSYVGLGDDKFVEYGICFERSALGQQLLYNRDYGPPIGLQWRDTGINPGPWWVLNGDSPNFTFWRTVKLVVDPTGVDALYSYIEVDGCRYDMSGLGHGRTTRPSSFQANTMQMVHAVYTQEAFNKTMYFDDVALTADEP